MHISDTLTRFLAEMEYPATKDDLLREGIRSELPWRDLEHLETLPDGSYQSGWVVRRELGAMRLVRAAGDALARGALHGAVA